MTTGFNIRLCCWHLGRNVLVSFRRDFSTSQLKKYYEILNVNSKSTVKEIKASFLRLSKVYHPDNKLTGSHNKFLELKEAYDALKNGPSVTTSDTTPPKYGSNSYSAYDDYTDLRYNGSAYHRSKGAGSQSFGGPFYNNKTPWEDYKRAQKAHDAYRSARYANHRSSGTINLTLLMSAVAWIIIFACATTFWDARLQRRRERAQQYHDHYLQRLKNVESMEAAIRRRAMVKRAQQVSNYSSPPASTSADDASGGQQKSRLDDLKETPNFAINQ